MRGKNSKGRRDIFPDKKIPTTSPKLHKLLDIEP
jgi:hypothetical protein